MFAFFLLAAGAVVAVVGICVTEEGCSGRKTVVVLGAGGGVGGGGGEGGHGGWLMRRGYCLLLDFGGIIGDGGLGSNGKKVAFEKPSLENWLNSGRPLEKGKVASVDSMLLLSFFVFRGLVESLTCKVRSFSAPPKTRALYSVNGPATA